MLFINFSKQVKKVTYKQLTKGIKNAANPTSRLRGCSCQGNFGHLPQTSFAE